MEYSEFHLNTIVKVEAYFAFNNFDFHPDLITKELGIKPDKIDVKGDPRETIPGKSIITPFNSWGVKSNSDSKDINFHIKQLLTRLKGLESKMNPKFGAPYFGILYKSNYLYAGSGPYFEPEVIQGIAKFKAEMVFDIIQVDQDLSEEEPKSRFRRLTREDLGLSSNK